jgi:hypothetical protein
MSAHISTVDPRAGADYSRTILVKASPEAAFAAINNVRGWWDGQIEGDTERPGDVFTYRYGDVHYSKQELIEVIPFSRIAWRVVEASLNFVDDRTEWTGTIISFDIAAKGEMTEVRFTHVGLVPAIECYASCSDAWGGLISSSLRGLIETGKAGASPFG